MPAGRPSSYKPEYCEQVVELGREGKSKAQIAAVLDVDRETIDNWAAKQPDFSRSVTRARELSLAWWEEQGQKGIWSREFNANAYSLQVRNRFPNDWRERQELTGKDGSPLIPVSLTESEIDKRLAELMAGQGKPNGKGRGNGKAHEG
jgi:hypothetical protein